MSEAGPEWTGLTLPDPEKLNGQVHRQWALYRNSDTELIAGEIVLNFSETHSK